MAYYYRELEIYDMNAKRIRQWLKDGDAVKEFLARHGADLTKLVCDKYGLREVSRRTELSPTYLSRVQNGLTDISPRAYLLLSQMG